MKLHNIIFITVIVIGLGILILPFQALAQASDVIIQKLTDPNLPGKELTVQWAVDLLKGWACYFIRFAIISFTGMMVVYGILFLKSRGNPQGMMSSRKALSWGIVGGIVIFAVFTIILSVASLIGVDYPILDMFNC